MTRSRGMTIYVGLHVVLTIAVLAAALAYGSVTAAAPGGPGVALYVEFAAIFVAYLQSQFLAAWMMLGPQRAAVRILVGGVAVAGVFAAPFVAGIGEHGLLWFSLKTTAVFTLLPLAVVCVGLLPETFVRRRIRFVERPLRGAGARRQFSLRMIFVYTLLAAVFVGASQFFPIRIATGDEEPWFSPRATLAGPGGFIVTAHTIEVSYSAAILAIPLATVVAAYVLLLPGRVWWFIPAPALAGLAGGVAASAMEMGGIPVEAAVIGVVCAVGSVFPIAHFLILRACGYRLVTEERSPKPRT